MNTVRLDLGLDLDPFPPLAEVLSTHPALAERCRAMGWFAQTLANVEEEETDE